MEVPDFDWRIILKCILKQNERKRWTEFIFHMTGIRGGFLNTLSCISQKKDN